MRMVHYGLACVALAVALPTFAGDKTAPFSLPELPYSTDALEPAINAETMELHHGKHHQGYVDKLNDAVEGDSGLQDMTLKAMLSDVSEHPEAVRNNGGGHWNHSFFWKVMAPAGDGGKPSPALKSAIEEAFGSMEAFKNEFQQAGTSQFGSGWVWLILNDQGELAVTSTPNQDNPLMDVAEEQGKPILGNDVWEHAYYLTHKNQRGEYLSAWWDVVDWNAVSENYERATSK